MSFYKKGISLILVSILFTVSIIAQQLTDEVRSKLNDADQKKLTKAEDLKIKGDLILSKNNYPGDSQILDMLKLGETKEIKRYLGRRDEASICYKDANLQKFNIYAKNCKDVYSKITGDQNLLTEVVKSENEMIKLFNDARNSRKVLEKKSKLSERFPLLFDAELKENKAIEQLQKILITYINHPSPINSDWFGIKDTSNSNTKQVSEPLVSNVESKNTNTDTTTISNNTQNLSSVNSEILPENKIESKPANSDSIPAVIKNPNTETGNTPNDTSIYTLNNVNEEQVDSFNSFLQKKYPQKYESYIIDYQSIDYSDMQSIRNAWYRYKFGIPEDSLESLNFGNISLNDSINVNGIDTVGNVVALDYKQSSNNQNITNKKTNNKSGLKSGNTIGTKDKNQVIAQNNSHKNNTNTIHNSGKINTKTTGTNTQGNIENTEVLQMVDRKNEPIATGFIYKVQIAASRVQLSKHEIDSIYSGELKVSESFEDNWYKYIIGEFNTYKEARNLRNRTNVRGVFVVAYLNGIRIKITTANSSPYAEITDGFGIDPTKIEFRVQIFASKVAMSEKYLHQLYSGEIPIDVIEEEGLYKYSLLAGKKLNDALKLYDTINIPTAFVVAYYEYKKLNLNTAIKLTRKL